MLLIDGYNLIFLSGVKADKVDSVELKRLRDNLIWKLNRYAEKKDATVIVVFDSPYEDPLKQCSYKKEGRVEVIYTSKGLTADKVIIDIVQKSPSPSNYTVVTSDSSIVKTCSNSGSKVMTSETFLKKLFSTFEVQEDKGEDKNFKAVKEKLEGISKEDAKFWLDVFNLPEDLDTDKL